MSPLANEYPVLVAALVSGFDVLAANVACSCSVSTCSSKNGTPISKPECFSATAHNVCHACWHMARTIGNVFERMLGCFNAACSNCHRTASLNKRATIKTITISRGQATAKLILTSSADRITNTAIFLLTFQFLYKGLHFDGHMAMEQLGGGREANNCK